MAPRSLSPWERHQGRNSDGFRLSSTNSEIAKVPSQLSSSSRSRRSSSGASEPARVKRIENKEPDRRHRDRHLSDSSRSSTKSRTQSSGTSETTSTSSTYWCGTCDGVFKWYEQLQDHRLMHQRERKPLECFDCKGAFWTKYQFEQHVCEPQKKKEISHRRRSSSESPLRIYRDRSCSERKRKRTRGQPRARGKRMECFKCGLKFKDGASLARHQKWLHPQSTHQTQDGSLRRVKSPVCNRRPAECEVLHVI